MACSQGLMNLSGEKLLKIHSGILANTKVDTNFGHHPGMAYLTTYK